MFLSVLICSEEFLCVLSYVEQFLFSWNDLGNTQEAEESTQDPDGRWFSFDLSVADNAYIILEKKSLPNHLQGLENADTPVLLQSLVSDLQDLGEAWGNKLNRVFSQG